MTWAAWQCEALDHEHVCGDMALRALRILRAPKLLQLWVVMREVCDVQALKPLKKSRLGDSGTVETCRKPGGPRGPKP